MKLTIPDVGWFHIALTDSYEARVSYLVFPFGDMCDLVRKAYVYNAPGSVEFDGEGKDSLLVYNHVDKTMELWDENTGERFAKKVTRRDLLETYLPLFGIQALFLYFGSNILQFTTTLPEYDLKGIAKDELENPVRLMEAIHDKVNEDYAYRSIKRAIARIATVLNITHSTAIFHGENKNPEWVKKNILCLRSFMMNSGVDCGNHEDVRIFIENIIYGNFNQIPGLIHNGVISPNDALMAFIGLYSVYNLYSMRADALQRDVELNDMVEAITSSCEVINHDDIVNYIENNWKDCLSFFGGEQIYSRGS